jgi:pantoate--beta-alanine ligase
MNIVTHPHEWKRQLRKEKDSGSTIGFVPTMGALHAGHEKLLRQARGEHDILAVSIFVNPAQFNDPNDLENYPRTLEQDKQLLQRLGADYLFVPDAQSMYPDGYRYTVEEHDFSHTLCGAGRPGHFTGVLTVVMKLLLLTGADEAYFGEKDYQQYVLVRDMVNSFFLDTRIKPVETVREASGLALSSRNKLLSAQEYALAPRFHEILVSSGDEQEATQRLAGEGFDPEYVERVENRRLAAVRLGKVRLIDNVRLS